MKTVSLFPSSPYDTGSAPSASLAGPQLIEVHKNQAGSKLYYHVGQVADGLIHWGPSTYYDDGNPAKCALNSAGVALEVHQSNGLYTNMWYHVGQVAGDTISWSKKNSQKYNSGSNPDIALNDGNLAALVYEKDKTIYLTFGQVSLSSGTIGFGDANSIGAGKRPSVALDTTGHVLIVFESDSRLRWWLGQIDGSVISHLASGDLPDGQTPSVALNDEGLILVGYDDGQLKSLIGQLNTGPAGISWQAPTPIGKGSLPSVTLSGDLAAQVHADTGLSYTLLASAAPVLDHQNWMGLQPGLPAKSLKEIIFPAAHDASMYTTQSCTLGGFSCNTQTQNLDFLHMLNMGIRYFDVRPCWYENNFETGHFGDTPVGIQGCNGGNLADILQDVATFADQSAGEVVILKFSHYYNRTDNHWGFDASLMEQLIAQVKAQLGPHLYVNQGSTRLADLPLATLTADGHTVILAVFDEASAYTQPENGIYSYADYVPGAPLNADLVVYDQYSNTNDLSKMMADQFSKQEEVANHGGDLFLLSWTLTQSATQASTCVSGLVDSILDLATKADTALNPELLKQWNAGNITAQTLPNVLYVDLANSFATDTAIRLNERLNT